MRRFLAVLLFAVAGLVGSLVSVSAASAATTIHVIIVNDPDSGFCGNWSLDDLLRVFTVKSLGGDEYAVTTNDYGSWHAIPGAIAPLNPTCDPTATMRNTSGPMYGSDTFTVIASGPASQRNLDENLPVHHGYLNGSVTDYAGTVLAIFPTGATFAPGGEFTTWYDQYVFTSYRTEVQIQSYLGYSDTPVGIFTNGGL